MIIAYFQGETKIESIQLTDKDYNILEPALWIDLLNPTETEEDLIEKYLDIDIPTKKEMEEIEPSSRLYTEDDVLFMTTTLVAFSDLPTAKTEVVTFIFMNQKIITVRYADLHAFDVFSNKLLRAKRKKYDTNAIFLGLLDSITERLADILEKIAHTFDQISQSIFHENINSTSPDINYKTILQNIGANGDLAGKARESIVSFTRMISFLEVSELTFSAGMQSHLKTIKNDMQAISDYAGFISTKVNFLLDATLGMINIDQNNIIKIFSIAAVIFLPPTLIASLYGMNFKFMPELDWHLGYPLAILLMIISAVLPVSYFKKKKWI